MLLKIRLHCFHSIKWIFGVLDSWHDTSNVDAENNYFFLSESFNCHWILYQLKTGYTAYRVKYVCQKLRKYFQKEKKRNPGEEKIQGS